MKVLIDGDGCPVIKITEKIAKEKGIPVLILCDTSHVITSEYGEVIIVSKGADCVDFSLINKTQKGDVIVTQDYGVAAMSLSKGAYPIHQNGKWYTNENIDQMLFERHMAKKARNASGKSHLKGPKKRTEEDDLEYEKAFRRLIERIALNEEV